MLKILFIILIILCIINSLDSLKLVIIILSQHEQYHAAHAELQVKDIIEQATDIEMELPEIVQSHKLNINGSWTITPLLRYLSSTFTDSTWFLFCTESTVLRLSKLLKILSKFSSNKDLYIGHALHDNEPTIIHHFAQHTKEFKYPNFASGFALNKKLLNRLTKNGEMMNDFSIDASYEFAKFVFENHVKLTHTPEFCIVSGSECATYPKQFHACSTSISTDKIYVAVKTCSKYHQDRIPVIRKTWAKYVTNLGFYSDKADEHLNDVYIVANTTQGHCAKTYAILKHADIVLRNKNLHWLVVTDDDTILGIGNLLRLLTCYNFATSVALGERYGYRVWNALEGYDYLTGGAGVILSTPLVHRLIEPGVCECPSSSTPDDMFLFGVCLIRIGVKPIHSSAFHQARPDDYASGYLASYDPISFHKFWMINPELVYEHWFKNSDSLLDTETMHTEL